jgi:hypothetical protein
MQKDDYSDSSRSANHGNCGNSKCPKGSFMKEKSYTDLDLEPDLQGKGKFCSHPRCPKRQSGWF